VHPDHEDKDWLLWLDALTLQQPSVEKVSSDLMKLVDPLLTGWLPGAALQLLILPANPVSPSRTSTTATYVSNSPASTVRFERRFYDSARCQGNAEVALFGPEDGKYYLSVEFGDLNNQYNLSGVIEEPNDKSFTIVLPLRNSQTGDILGEYEVAVTLAPKDKATTTVLRTATARIAQRTTLYDVSAQVSLPSIDIDASCEALEVTTREIIRAAQGPKPTATTAQRRSGRCATDRGR